MGSPLLLLSQPPPNPCHSALPTVGPSTTAPVVLLNTANEVLTHCTYWVRPTAPFVSGGAEVTEKVPLGPVKPCPRPSKLRRLVTATWGPVKTWTTGSAWASVWTGTFPRVFTWGLSGLYGVAEISRSGRDTSCLTSGVTSTGPPRVWALAAAAE